MSSNIIGYCREVLSSLITLSYSFTEVFTLIILISVGIGFTSLILQLYRTNCLIKSTLKNKILVSERLYKIALKLGIVDKIDVAQKKENLSFCYGLLKPHILLSTGLLKTLTNEELKAVLLHESYHVQNRDPLKIILGRTASKMFFFIPILKDIQNFYTFSKEIAADKLVIQNGYKQPLISTLSKLLIPGSPKFAGVAALANLDDLEKRILYLMGNQRKAVFKPSLLSISLSTFIVLFSMILVNTPVYAVRADDSCKAKEAVSYNKDLMYTPASYTPR